MVKLHHSGIINICNSGQQEGESGQQVSVSVINNEQVEDGEF